MQIILGRLVRMSALAVCHSLMWHLYKLSCPIDSADNLRDVSADVSPGLTMTWQMHRRSERQLDAADHLEWLRGLI